jgi:hypothetical protein
MSRTDPVSEETSLLGRVLDWMKAHLRTDNEFSGFSREELGHMARDLGVTEADMLGITPRGADNTALMQGMMRARGLDPDVVRESFTTLQRDIERVCTRCRSTGRCHRELSAGTAGEHSHEFCPNAGTFDDLIEYNMGR